MVIVLSAKTSSVDNEILRRVLKKGRYATLDLKARIGADHSEEVVLVQRILDGMISPEDYPPSPKARKRSPRGEIASWENEGGSIDPNVKE
ncbi:hypothetical protein [Rhizobium sp. LC145]|uniref:hypothetical protein n=1 Tax=Rhizobium sp. LC145 TaxID=1120688 RepID=UPI000629E675|nr:hypothetical protein [Rhizobium sp. LC145]KKX32887.1 hypothetical protein YH62_04860 [Rhizobium sp. LC145]TKT57300.1 hypothetical protein FDR95_13510 [Rhizobiaceae bacterium LC148]